jgi:CubicO group peptidase (beta-lactamase class C family)
MDVCGITDLFEENFVKYGELGASVSIWYRGEKVLDLSDGFQDREKTIPWDARSVVLIWSATKALASASLLHAAQEHRISLDRHVADFWPEYGQNGKEETTLRHFLSHQAGQPALRESSISILDHESVVKQLASQEPFWKPGTGHGYHARTYGFLLDELLRRITGGTTMGQYFQIVFAEPANLRLWMGTPEELEVAPIFAPKKTREGADEEAFYAALAEPGSLTRQAFATPKGLHTPSMMNDPKVRAHSLPSLGGIGSAEALARFYEELGRIGEPLYAKEISEIQCSGPDKVLKIETAFGLGFMKDPVIGGQKVRQIFGSSMSSFGQPGSGGSVGFCDLENQISFAYVMNQMEPGVMPNAKSLRMIEHLYATLS